MKIFAYYAIMDYYNRVVNFDALLATNLHTRIFY